MNLKYSIYLPNINVYKNFTYCSFEDAVLFKILQFLRKNGLEFHFHEIFDVRGVRKENQDNLFFNKQDRDRLNRANEQSS